VLLVVYPLIEIGFKITSPAETPKSATAAKRQQRTEWR
jgi:hypothetical protein